MNRTSQTKKIYTHEKKPSHKVYRNIRQYYYNQVQKWCSEYIIPTSQDTTTGIYAQTFYNHFISKYNINPKQFSITAFCFYFRKTLRTNNINIISKISKKTIYFGIAIDENHTKNIIIDNNKIKNLTQTSDERNYLIYDKIKAWVLENIIIDKKFNNKIRTKVILNYYLKSHNLPETFNVELIKKFANILFQISLTENLELKPITQGYSYVANIQIKNNFIKQTNKKILIEKKVINKNIFYATIFTYLSFNIFFFSGLLYFF